MSVEWSKIDGKISNVRTELVEAKSLLDLPFDDKLEVRVPLKDTEESFNLGRFVVSLGDYGRVLLNENDISGVRDALLKYWVYKGMPKVRFEFVEASGALLPLRKRVVLHDEKKAPQGPDVGKVVEGVNRSFKYDRTVVGTDGDNLELQFLNRGIQREVLPGDFVDGGLFVRINGRVEISAGLNRLVCNNGLTERFWLMRETDFSGADEILQRAVNLIGWLSEQTGHKVESVRALSVMLKDYSRPFLEKFWKSWSERVELQTLTYFDVVADLTQSVNDTLSRTRYRVISAFEPVRQYQVAEHRCPVCSAKA